MPLDNIKESGSRLEVYTRAVGFEYRDMIAKWFCIFYEYNLAFGNAQGRCSLLFFLYVVASIIPIVLWRVARMLSSPTSLEGSGCAT